MRADIQGRNSASGGDWKLSKERSGRLLRFRTLADGTGRMGPVERTSTSSARRTSRYLLPLAAAACVLLPHLTAAQGLTGTLIGTVKDDQGGVLPGAVVRVSSAALIGGLAT